MTYQDIMISPLIGFHSSTWRANGNYIPDYATYAPTVTYTGAPFLSSDPSFTLNLSDIYGEIFWNTFFEVLFPSVTEQEFLNELSTGTPGGYYTQLYAIAARDFYDSFFRGRDDSRYPNPQVAPPPSTPTTFSWWSDPSLSDDEKKLIIKKYLMSRGAYSSQTFFSDNVFLNGQMEGKLVDRAFMDSMFLNNLNLRTTNIFFYVASLMVGIMEELQSNTINAAKYATRLAQTQQAISTEMTNSKYAYKTLTAANDYGTISINENHGKELENMRSRRDLIQKETDQASGFLETSQQAVEDAAGKALDFLKKGSEMVQLFFRAY